MLKRLIRKPWLMLVSGLTVGVLVGLLFGAALTRNADSGWQFPVTQLHASSTHGGSTMAIATGPIDEGTEGLFVLDFITGEIQCSVLNPRNGQLGGMFKHNVVADLGVEQGKQPKYLLVTGAANFRTGGGNMRPAQSVVYVADANTGRYAAYMLPWNRSAAQYNFAQVNPFVLLGKGTARNIQLEAN